MSCIFIWQNYTESSLDFQKKKKNVFGVFILSAIYKANIQVHDTMKKKN